MAKGDSSAKGYITCGECKHAFAGLGLGMDGDVWCCLRHCNMFNRWSCGDAERREDDQESEEHGEDESR